MLWTPDRTLWTPPARGTRRPRRPFARAYGMADGDVTLDDSGNRILDASGNSYRACCCPVYIRAKLCSDDSDADAWFPYQVISGVKYAVVNSLQYALPVYLTKSGVKYYIADGNTLSPPYTPLGTLGTGFTVTTTCATCAACRASSATSYMVTFASITTNCCTFRYAIGTTGSIGVSGDPNGSYTISTPSGFCNGTTTAGVSVKAYNATGDCSGAAANTQSVTVRLNISPSSGVVDIEYTTPNGALGYIFHATLPTSMDCRSAITVNNDLASSCTTNDGTRLGSGGTCTITPL